MSMNPLMIKVKTDGLIQFYSWCLKILKTVLSPPSWLTWGWLTDQEIIKTKNNLFPVDFQFVLHICIKQKFSIVLPFKIKLIIRFIFKDWLLLLLLGLKIWIRVFLRSSQGFSLWPSLRSPSWVSMFCPGEQKLKINWFKNIFLEHSLHF